MQILVSLYDKVLTWAQHKYAPRYLAAVSFMESSVFPIPPDFMLAPMVLAHPKKAFNYASITTLASVSGALLGYCLGLLVFVPVVVPFLQLCGYYEQYLAAIDIFNTWGFVAILMAGFTPIPYKLFTIGAGMLNYALVPFVLASVASRASRFFLVALLIKIGGQKMEKYLLKLLDNFGWTLAIISISIILLYGIKS